MNRNQASLETHCNFARFSPEMLKQGAGHYESYFQRANHPDRPLAFWIRYTIFVPRGRPKDAMGELWAVYFDGETNRHTAVKKEMPLSECSFSPDEFRVRAGDALLDGAQLRGAVQGREEISWDLRYESNTAPVFLFPENLYHGSFPKAKVLVGFPLARFHGELRVNGTVVSVDGWPGSQNHNWGSKHTDRYAWGQVSGFDNSPDTFLELATARLKFGPLWTPAFTPVVLVHEGRQFRLNELTKTFRRASFGYFHWDFHAEGKDVALVGRIYAKREDFVCLRYYNPPGGSKFCLNSKIAACELEIRQKGRPAQQLVSKSRAAFEILTDEDDHGMTPAC